jgi:subfamily B ATP-binding cassette protein MsbA
MSYFKRLIKYIKPYKGRFIFALLNMGAVALFTSLLTWVVKELMDEILVKARSEMLMKVCAMIFIFYLGKGISSFFSSYMMESIGIRIIRDLRAELFEHLIYQSMAYLQSQKTGDLQTKVVYDTEKIKIAVSQTVGDLLKEGLVLIGLLFYIFWLDWKLSLLACLLLPVSVYPIVKFSEKIRKASLHSHEGASDLNHLINETIYAARVVKAYCMEKFEINRFKQVLRKVVFANLKASRISSLSTPLMELIGGIGAILVIIYAGHQIKVGASTAGKITSFLAAVFFMYTPIKKLSRANNTIQEASAAIQRVYNVLDCNMRLVEKPNAIELKEIKESIQFDNVSFAYNDTTILKDINFCVKKGQKVAIIGSSGVGKSTLVNLIPRLYDPTSGRILIDGIDIRDFTIKSLREKIGVVTQDVILFNDTIRNNIAYGRENVSREEIERAAKAAYAHDFIMELEDQYDTVIGEWGQKLSGGQRQRIAIARAILKNPEILILDEATTSLDAESEAFVQNAISNLLVGRTAFIVTHHLSSIKDADNIIVLDAGKIKAQGSHDFLLETEPMYTRLCELQMLD